MAYLLDANGFIDAKNYCYGMDFCPAFWDWMIREHKAENLFSIEHVGAELKAGKDELVKWAKEGGTGFFLPPDDKAHQAMEQVSEWAKSGNYKEAAPQDFLDAADGYLVAQALADSHIVVTRERSTDSIKRIKIPNACAGLKIKYMTPYEMLRLSQARFVLEH